MKDSTILKIIEITQTPVVQIAQDVVDKVGKTSAIGGATAYAAEKALTEPSTLPQIGAAVSIVGGLIWIASIIFNMFITWLKYKRGDEE